VSQPGIPKRLWFHSQGRPKNLFENAASFRAIVEEALRKTGGPLKPKERAWARKTLSREGAQPSRGRPRERSRFPTLAG